MAREPCGGGCFTTIGYAVGKREGRAVGRARTRPTARATAVAQIPSRALRTKTSEREIHDRSHAPVPFLKWGRAHTHAARRVHPPCDAWHPSRRGGALHW